MRNAVYKEGALDGRTKELISIAASVLMRCERCTEIHAERSRKHGATDEQIAEAVACAMFVAAGLNCHGAMCMRRLWEGLINRDNINLYYPYIFSKFRIFMNNVGVMEILQPCRQFAPEVLPGWFGQDEQDLQDTSQ